MILNHKRSYFEPLSNNFVIAQIELDLLIKEIISLGTPSKFLPTILHEVTHHWCLNSPVGTTLSLLGLKCRQHIIEKRKETISGQVIDDLAKCHCISYMLQPLLEGIALFMENDAQAGKSKAVSRPNLLGFFLTLGLHAEHGVTDENEMWYNYNNLLVNTRLENDYINKKANLLSQNFSCAEGGYLPGYLAVKSLYGMKLAAHSDSLVHDSDLFISLLRGYIFDDWELVELLLKPYDDFQDHLFFIIDYIDDRLRKFISLDYISELKKLEDACCNDDYDLTQFSLYKNVFGINSLKQFASDKSEAGKNLFSELGDSFLTVKDNKSMFTLKSFYSDTFLTRSLIPIGYTLQVGVVKRSGWLSVTDDENNLLIEYKIGNKLKVGWSDIITVDVVATHSPELALFVVIGAKGSVIYVADQVNDDNKQHRSVKALIYKHYMPRILFNRFEEESFTSFNKYTSFLSDEFLTAKISRVYHDLTVVLVDNRDDKNLDDIINKLQPNGFMDLFNKEGELDLLAQISLVASNIDSSLLNEQDIQIINAVSHKMREQIQFYPFGFFGGRKLYSVI